MQNLLIKRLIALLFFVMGIGLAIWLKYAHNTGASLNDRDILLMPLLILYGIAGMINPGLIFFRWQAKQTPMPLRVMSFIIVLVGMAIGFWLREVVFKDWR